MATIFGRNSWQFRQTSARPLSRSKKAAMVRSLRSQLLGRGRSQLPPGARTIEFYRHGRRTGGSRYRLVKPQATSTLTWRKPPCHLLMTQCQDSSLSPKTSSTTKSRHRRVIVHHLDRCPSFELDEEMLLMFLHTSILLQNRPEFQTISRTSRCKLNIGFIASVGVQLCDRRPSVRRVLWLTMHNKLSQD
jgi:hypothetical protein